MPALVTRRSEKDGKSERRTRYPEGHPRTVTGVREFGGADTPGHLGAAPKPTSAQARTAILGRAKAPCALRRARPPESKRFRRGG